MMRPALASDELQRIAVFRALNLGDLLCSMPAFEALRAAFPKSRIVLIGLASAAPLVDRFSHCIDELLVFPGDRALPEQPVRPGEQAVFRRRVAAERFDLILQMHGSGLHTNRLVQALPARQWAGFVPELRMEEHGRLMHWPDSLPEARRYLRLLDWLGFPVHADARPAFPLRAEDFAEADAVSRAHGLVPDETVFLHPGSRLSSRRWPLERFAAVAAALADGGWKIAVTGSPAERQLGANLCVAIGGAAFNLCGMTSLGGLAALLCRGRLLICNDTGVSHVAAGVGARSVVIASGSDVRRWTPGDASRHVVLHWETPCRPCAHVECPYAHPCARGVTVEQVLAQARLALEEVPA